LLAIAEKASASDRTASVRWDHIRSGLYGASRRTAERAVQELLQAGLIRIAKSGFKNQYGQSRAPLYEILRISDSAIQVAESAS
jgi:predicted transcriptional regulator